MIKGNYGAILPNLSRNRNPNIALKLIRAEQLMGASSAMPAARRIFLGSDSSMPGGTVTKGWGGGGGFSILYRDRFRAKYCYPYN